MVDILTAARVVFSRGASRNRLCRAADAAPWKGGGANEGSAAWGQLSSVLFRLFLALGQRLADQHRQALELVERLLQLEVLVAAELR